MVNMIIIPRVFNPTNIKIFFVLTEYLLFPASACASTSTGIKRRLSTAQHYYILMYDFKCIVRNKCYLFQVFYFLFLQTI